MPSVETALIVTVFPLPAFLAVTTPLEFTVAYFLLDVLQARALLAVLPAFTEALTVTFRPAGSVFFWQERVIFFTASLTILIFMDAFFLLASFALAVTVMVLPAPAFLVETMPLAFTVAYFLFDLVFLPLP